MPSDSGNDDDDDGGGGGGGGYSGGDRANSIRFIYASDTKRYCRHTQ